MRVAQNGPETKKFLMKPEPPEIPEVHLRAYPNEEINELPIQKYEGEVRLVHTQKQLESAVKRLSRSRIIGFDTETRPVFKKGRPQNPPALIQLANSECVYIFQLKRQPFNNGLRDVLADPGIIKAGVAVTDDIKGLKGLSHFREAGFVDLGVISNKLNMKTHGLRNMAANLLGFRITKGAQCSNWERINLSNQQIQYAATDAWVSRELYLALDRLGAF